MGLATCAAQLLILPPSLGGGMGLWVGSPLISSCLPPFAPTASPRRQAPAQARRSATPCMLWLGPCRVMQMLLSTPWSLTSNRTSSGTPLSGSHDGMGALMGKGALSGAGLSAWERGGLGRVNAWQRCKEG